MGVRDQPLSEPERAFAKTYPRRRGPASAWRRRWSIALATVALWPVALTTTLSHNSGAFGVGPWDVTFHNVTNRPTLLLELTAAALWLAAAALWSSRSTRVRLASVALAAALIVGCAATMAMARHVRSAAVPASLFNRFRSGASESSVIAALGAAPERGTGTRAGSSASVACLVYGSNGQTAFCFRDGKLVSRLNEGSE